MKEIHSNLNKNMNFFNMKFNLNYLYSNSYAGSIVCST